MKLALLLPGFLDSPDYAHLMTFEKRLKELGYTVDRLDACNLWSTGNTSIYTITNYLKQIEERISFYKNQNPEEIILIGHSLGGLVSIIAGNRIDSVTSVVSLCSPGDIVNLAKKWQGSNPKHSERDLPDSIHQMKSFEIPYTFVEDGLQYSAIKEVKELQKPIMIFIALGDKSVLPQETEKIIVEAHNPYVVRKDMEHNFRYSLKDCEIVMEEIEKFLTNRTTLNI
ncbi:MAG: alpha/beta hydrolase [Candidatus Roizmanbacteria bacterium]|nr:alpha/beta hydrolase [Candidatus Roizmanbacteria bacterium]